MCVPGYRGDGAKIEFGTPQNQGNGEGIVDVATDVGVENDRCGTLGRNCAENACEKQQSEQSEMAN
jgi:hypothetical protein